MEHPLGPTLLRGWKLPIETVVVDPRFESSQNLDPKPFVREACSALGYVHPDRIEWLCQAAESLPGEDPRGMARKIIAILCPDWPKGSRKNPDLSAILVPAVNEGSRNALETLLRRAMSNLGRAKGLFWQQDAFEVLKVEIEFCANRNYGCDRSRAADGSKYPSIDETPPVPLPGCDKPWCGCIISACPIVPQ